MRSGARTLHPKIPANVVSGGDFGAPVSASKNAVPRGRGSAPDIRPVASSYTSGLWATSGVFGRALLRLQPERFELSRPFRGGIAQPLNVDAALAAVIIAGLDQGPAGMGLAFDIGRRGIILRIQRIELLIETLVGGDAGINSAANWFNRSRLHLPVSHVGGACLSLRPKKRGPFHRVPVIAKATLLRLS